MTILFSPSEGKTSGGSGAPLNPNSFIFPERYDTRIEPARHYNDFVASADETALKKIFGTKDGRVVDHYRKDIFSLPTKKAVERYEGVAYDYLDFPNLDETAKAYVESNVIIFSNIFGPIRAGDMIPEYKFKQGSKLPGIEIEKYFKSNFSDALDAYVDNDIIDLRAGFYEKFYSITKNYLTFKFLKEGKVVSHWAKAYRGTILRVLAQKQIETVDALMKIPINGLNLIDIKTIKNKKEILFELTD